MADVLTADSGQTIVEEIEGGTLVTYGENAAEAARQAALAEMIRGVTEELRDDAEAAAAIALAAAATSGDAAARAAEHLAGWFSAAGDGARWLHTADGQKGWQDDDPLSLLVEEMGPLYGPAGAFLEQGGTIFDGSGPSPVPAVLPKWVQTATGPGIEYHYRTGFSIAAGILSDAATAWSIERVLTWTSYDDAGTLRPYAATYADMTAANAALADHPVGTVIWVPPVIDAGVYGIMPAEAHRGAAIQSSEIVGGYLVRGHAAWDKYFATVLCLRDGTGSKFVLVNIDGLGRLFVFGDDLTRASSAYQLYDDVLAFEPGKPQSFRLDCDPDDLAMRLFWNGVEVGARNELSALPTFVPASVYTNGAFRSGSGTHPGPLAGGCYIEHALSITEGLDYPGNKRVSDWAAATFGSPAFDWTPQADLIVMSSQSEWASGEGGTGSDPNRPDSVSGWNGEIARRTTNDLIAANPSQERIPGVFGFRGLDNSQAIGPLAIIVNADGINGTRFNASGGNTETWEWGAAKQLRKWTRNHLYCVAASIGGSSLAQITSQGGTYLHALGEIDAAGDLFPHYRDQLNLAVKRMIKRIRKRGQTPRIIGLLNMQGGTDAPTAGTALAHENDVRQQWDDELRYLVEGQGKPPLMVAAALNYSYDGTSSSTNTSGINYVDDAYRRLGANKDAGHPIRPWTSRWSMWGRHVHHTTEAIRRAGEHLGDLIARYWYGNEFVDPFGPIAGATLGTGGDAGKFIIPLNRAAAIRNPTADPDELDPRVPNTRTTGGFNTYGFNEESAGAAINGHVTLRTVGGVQQVLVPYSGSWANGDRLNFLGPNNMWGNIFEAEERWGEYDRQVWPTSFPFADADPPVDYTPAAKNDLREGLAAFSLVFNGSAFV